MSVSINGIGSITGIDQGFNITNGSVGIGTDNPDATLKINVASGNNGVVVQNTSTANIALLGARNGDATVQIGQWGSTASGSTFGLSNADLSFIYTTSYSTTHPSALALGTVSNKPIVFATDNTERLRIDSNGYVKTNSEFWIGGGASPVLRWRDGSNEYATARINSGNLYFEVAGTEKVRITSDGKFGINTSSPGSLLSVSGGTDDDSFIRMNNEEVGLYFGAWGTGSTYPREATINGTRFDSGSSPFLRIGGQGGIKFCADLNTERMRITSDGKMGLGTQSPEVLLHLSETNADPYNTVITHLKLNNSGGNGGSGSRIELKTGAARCWIQSFIDGANSNSGGALVFGTPSSAALGTERLRISSDGKVCVGTTLTNYGVLQIRDASGDNTTSAIQVENASSGNSTTNVILRSVSLNSGAWANAEYRAKSHVFSHQTTPVLSVLANYGPWAEGNKGTTRGTLHLKPGTTDHMGGAITFGASDSGSGETAMAGIYTRSDGTYGTKMYFATTNSYAAGPKNAMTINHHGQVTFSSQPCFWATSNTGGSDTNNGYHGIISNQLEAAYVNVGNHYNTSTGVFTCPVDGVYEFHGQGLARQQGGDGNMELTFFKNGSNVMTRSYGYTYVKGSSDHDNLHVMAYISCAANDQIDLRTHALASGVDCYWAQGLGYFAGRLVQ